MGRKEQNPGELWMLGAGLTPHAPTSQCLHQSYYWQHGMGQSLKYIVNTHAKTKNYTCKVSGTAYKGQQMKDIVINT